MESRGAVIAARLREWGALDLPVEREVFGTAVPEEIADAVDAWCRAHLGAPVERYEFFESSSGSVHGVLLTDGRAVVVKGHRAAVSHDFLAAVTAIQSALVESEYPAPRPVAGPVAVGRGHVTAEVMLDRSPDVDRHDPAVRAVLAAGLAQFIVLAKRHCDRLARFAHPMSAPERALYPTPHSPRFDFASTAAGAEWIDTLTARARARLRSLPEVPDVVVHGDWRIENLCVRAGRLVGVYDWDSLHVAREVAAVATAATTFSVAGINPPETDSRVATKSARLCRTTRSRAVASSRPPSATSSPHPWSRRSPTALAANTPTPGNHRQAMTPNAGSSQHSERTSSTAA
jgi:Phosphotransferase enzyme family